jgi:hypothetical protein
MFTTHDLTWVETDECCCHRLCAECQSGLSGVHFCTTMCATLGEMNHNCQVGT